MGPIQVDIPTSVGRPRGTRFCAARFFVAIPFKPFPVSWQDTGSGVFTFGLASLLLGIVMRREPAGIVIGLAASVALVAFLVDIYLY